MTTNGLFVRRNLFCGTRVEPRGRRVCARGGAPGVPLDRGSGGGIAGGGKLMYLVWKFLGITTVRKIPLDCVANAIFECGVGMPTKFTFRFRRIDSSAGLTIGTR